MKTTLKDIKDFAKRSYVTDITDCCTETLEMIYTREGYFHVIAFSIGTYGITGKILRGMKTGTLYAITKQNSAMFMF